MSKWKIGEKRENIREIWKNTMCFCKNSMHYIIRNRKDIDKRTEKQWENVADV
jgi:hypothetical protein